MLQKLSVWCTHGVVTICLLGVAACVESPQRNFSEAPTVQKQGNFSDTLAIEQTAPADICTKQYTADKVETILTAFLEPFAQPDELPAGWRFDYFSVQNDRPDAQGVGFVYRLITDTLTTRPVGFGAGIDVFRHLTDAKHNYLQQIEGTPAFINDEVTALVAFDTKADEHKILCNHTTVGLDIPYVNCSFVARYQCTTIDMRSDTFPDRWLTPQQFRNVLMALERRVVAAMESQK